MPNRTFLIHSRRQRFLNYRHLISRSAGLPVAKEIIPTPPENILWSTSPLACRESIGSQTRNASNQFCRKREAMFLGLGLLLLLLWLGGFFVFHVTAFFIHILLLLAVVSIIFHFMRGTASAV